MTATLRYASPLDAPRYGVYRPRRPGATGPLLRFAERITADGSSGLTAEPGRYHLYAGRFCPWSQRVVIELALHGLDEVVSVSYVDGLRDGRGWAFRPASGPDQVNGFALLREAYEASEPGFDGHVSVPALWDRQSGRIVSNDYRLIGIDVATQFTGWSAPGVDSYPAQLRDQIERLDQWLGPVVNQGVGLAAVSPAARAGLAAAFRTLDARLATHRYLLGDPLTEADVRLWVTLVRYDVGPNAHGRIGPRLAGFPHLWAYARDLYALPAFRASTDFASFAAPLAAIPAWDEPSGRQPL